MLSSYLQFPSNKQKVMALGHSHLLRWPTLCEVCFSLNKSISLPISLKKKKVMALVDVGTK